MPVKNRRLVLLVNALRQAREAAEVFRRCFAESKVDRSYISEIENGHKSSAVEMLVGLCPLLELSRVGSVEHSLQSARK